MRLLGYRLVTLFQKRVTAKTLARVSKQRKVTRVTLFSISLYLLEKKNI